MTVAEITEKLSQERSFGSRFPVRIIFAESLQTYTALESQLKAVCDVTINVANFCKTPDIAPQFDKMNAELSSYVDKQVLVLSLGEYLRLCTKRELDNQRGQFRAFWEQMQSEASRTRYIVPVFSCRDLFDRVVGVVDERQQDFVWTLDSTAETEIHNVSVYSPKFKETIEPDAENLSSWLRSWRSILCRGSYSTIVTSQYRNVELSYGTVNIKAIDSPFNYLVDYLVDGNILIERWQNDGFWAHMIAYTTKYGKSEAKFSKIVLDVLNVNNFDFVSVAARWKTLDAQQQSLVWMWYRAYPTDEYYSYACKKANTVAEIPERIRDEILLISNRSQRWIEERMAAMKALSFSSFDDSYFALLDKLPVAETRLQMLTYQTHEEKAYAIKVISWMLRNGAEPAAVADMIQIDYPILAAYMKDTLGEDTYVDEYMSWYRKNKLINRYPGNYPQETSFDRFDSRFKLLHKMNGKDCFTLWIDGFGTEWAPAFLYELKARGIKPESVKIATALLPTETEYNHQWDENDPMSTKWDRLDAYSHKGMPDDKSYYSCIVHQLSVFEDAAKKVDELLQEHEYVAVTGDHGSSRLAALAFHDPSVVPVTAPEKSTVRSFGRFCELGDNADSFIVLPGMTKAVSNGKTYVMMNTYQHFGVRGNAVGRNTDEHDVAGEIHGGNTTEERLVPVMIFRRSQPLPPITCKPKPSNFVTKKNSHIEITLEFSRAVSALEVSLGSNGATCVKNADGTWRVLLDGVTEEEFDLSIIANGRLLPSKITLKVKTQGINKNADPFGGGII